MYVPGKILKMVYQPTRVSGNSSAQAWVLDMTLPCSSGGRSHPWRFRVRITWSNAILPDGNLLVTGGMLARVDDVANAVLPSPAADSGTKHGRPSPA